MICAAPSQQPRVPHAWVPFGPILGIIFNGYMMYKLAGQLGAADHLAGDAGHLFHI